MSWAFASCHSADGGSTRQPSGSTGLALVPLSCSLTEVRADAEEDEEEYDDIEEEEEEEEDAEDLRPKCFAAGSQVVAGGVPCFARPCAAGHGWSRLVTAGHGTRDRTARAVELP